MTFPCKQRTAAIMVGLILATLACLPWQPSHRRPRIRCQRPSTA
jgi:hypothetical protein